NFGPEYLSPKPFDQRLILEIAPAVARAAMDSGVALNPIEDWNHYMNQLNAFVFRSGLMMKPVFDSARSNLRKVVFAEGEEMKVLQAVDFLRLEKLCKPIVLGRVEIINNRIAEGGLGIKPGVDFDIIEYDYNEEWCQTYHKLTERAGKTRKEADDLLRTSTTIQAALMVKMGLADSMICGTVGRYHRHLQRILSVTRQVGGINEVSAMTALLLSKHMFFICDTHVTPNPSVEAIVKMTLSAAEEVRSFGITPKVALLSHSNFGSSDTETSMKMRKALGEIQAQAPNLMVDGEMRASSAMSPKIREIMFPSSTLEGSANLLIMPNLDAANITYNLLKTTAHGLTIGPILLDCGIEAHITTPSSSVRGLVNLATIAASRCNRK
ncbi:MAG: malate dehydrogenase (oxaloacetate-decarboxylating)(NADP+), partial [Gammaproteobacteria bacterium]